jgi:uncharacterized membrane protein (UPF0127 family)
MRKVLFGLSILTVLVSCETKTDTSSVGVVDVVEMPFTKEGELEFINGNGEPFHKINIEFAETLNERSRGLMDRTSMEDGNGMLFIFGDDEVRKHTFYMKNTRMALDIMYFSADSTLINIARNAQPGAVSELSPGGTVAAAKEDSKFVVEINGGLADKLGMKEGETKIRWTRN